MKLPLAEAKADLVEQRVLTAVFGLLERSEALTFANVARASGVPERTCYRYFPSRDALLAAVLAATSARLKVRRATDFGELVELVRRLFRGFDESAPVIRELLLSPEGRNARKAGNAERQRAALALVAREVPDLDAASKRHVAATLQVLSSAAAWQAFNDYWGFDGNEAAEASILAAELILEGARARRSARPTRKLRAKGARAAKEIRT